MKNQMLLENVKSALDETRDEYSTCPVESLLEELHARLGLDDTELSAAELVYRLALAGYTLFLDPDDHHKRLSVKF